MKINLDKYQISIYLLFALATFHIPFITISEDSVGLYDIVLALYASFIFMRASKINALPYLLLSICFLIILLIGSIDVSDTFHWILVAKQVQYVVTFMVWYYLFKKSNFSEQDLVFVSILIAFAVIIFGSFRVFTQDCWRLCLVGQEGDSANAIASIIVICMLMIIQLATTRQKLFCLPILFFGLVLTFSRTNILAFFATIFLYSVFKKKFILLILIILVFIIASISMEFLPISYGYTPLDYVTNPSLMLEDDSFKKRYTTAWWNGYNPGLFYNLFGNGLGVQRVSDGLYSRLYIGSGAIGTLTYLFLFTLFFMSNSKLRYVLFFFAVNSLNTETLTNVFRVMQIFIPFIAFYVVHADKKIVLKKFGNF